MTDSEFTMFVFMWIFGFGVVVQSIRLSLLRRKFVRLALRDGPSAAIPDAPVQQLAQPRDDEEIDRIKKRLHVLERIATDGSAQLDSEFEALRRA